MGATETVLEVSSDHPSFEGHFPGRPVLPGAVMIAEVLAAIERASSQPVDALVLSTVKFFGVVEPGTPLTLRIEDAANGTIRFEIRSPRELVASGLVSRRTRSR